VKQNRPTDPFGMGRQGWAIALIIILVTVAFAATRTTWQSMVLSAVLPPLILFPLIYFLTRRWRDGSTAPASRASSGESGDLMTFLARTNPLMFLLFGVLSGRSNDDDFQQLFRSGPYGMGQMGYLVLLLLILSPLILVILITAVTGQQPGHIGPHFS
jgi:hypothetical protein